MLIVSGKIYVTPADRDVYLAGCAELIALARTAPGCLDFHLSGDPLEQGRINVYEEWNSAADVEAFRGSGPTQDQTALIHDARVFQHEVATSLRL